MTGCAAEALRSAIGLGAAAMPGGLRPGTWIEDAVLVREEDNTIVGNPVKGGGWGVSRYHLGLGQGWVEVEHAAVEVAGVNCGGKNCGNEGDGTGSTIWPGAFALVEYLLSGAVQLSGKRVLELGAGVGLCGLAAARLGSVATTLSDASEETLELLRTNVRRNPNLPGTTTVALLPFGEALRDEAQKPQIFDVVLGSELAYGRFSRNFADELFRSVDLSLAPGAQFVLSYCGRGVAADGPSFSAHVPLLAAAAAAGFGAEIHSIRGPRNSAQMLVVTFRRAEQRDASIAVGAMKSTALFVSVVLTRCVNVHLCYSALEAMEGAGARFNRSLRELDMQFVRQQVYRDEEDERRQLAIERLGKKPRLLVQPQQPRQLQPLQSQHPHSDCTTATNKTTMAAAAAATVVLGAEVTSTNISKTETESSASVLGKDWAALADVSPDGSTTVGFSFSFV
jgi:SAM-dependent methyltransferase